MLIDGKSWTCTPLACPSGCQVRPAFLQSPTHSPFFGLGCRLAAGCKKLANSTRQLMPGKTMRIGVNPGQRTLSRTKFVSAPKLRACEPLIQATESENC